MLDRGPGDRWGSGGSGGSGPGGGPDAEGFEPERTGPRGVDRQRAYFWIMGTCAVLVVLAWNVVRLFSVPLAIVMSAVAAVMPPVAVVVANWRRRPRD